MSCQENRDRLEGEEAHKYRVRCLKMLVDRRAASFEALLVCRETGQLWEETVEGTWSELLVLTKLSVEAATAKYGPLPVRQP